MNRDALWNELRLIRQQMQGINPKLSLYAKLQTQEKAIMKRLETYAREKQCKKH